MDDEEHGFDDAFGDLGPDLDPSVPEGREVEAGRHSALTSAEIEAMSDDEILRLGESAWERTVATEQPTGEAGAAPTDWGESAISDADFAKVLAYSDTGAWPVADRDDAELRERARRALGAVR